MGKKSCLIFAVSLPVQNLVYFVGKIHAFSPAMPFDKSAAGRVGRAPFRLVLVALYALSPIASHPLKRKTLTLCRVSVE
jgi:hypothetical protein